jgi:sec-independent protein translocase protein TatA
MGFSGAFSFWHWVVLLAVVILVFGTKRLATLGSDLGAAVKSFQKAVRQAGEESPPTSQSSEGPKLPHQEPAETRRPGPSP